MEYYVNGQITDERVFWGRVNVLGSLTHKRLILDGYKVKIAESIYWAEPKK